MLTAVERREELVTLLCGRLVRLGSQRGLAPGERVDLAGTLSALSWLGRWVGGLGGHY